MADPPRATLDDLRAVVARLHAPAPEGCPWCLEQTHESLADDLIKEAYEVGDAIARRDSTALAEELGDVLLLLVGHAHLAAAAGSFTLDDVIAQVTEKVIRRHPHVYGDVQVSTPEEVLHNWDAIKREERADAASVLEDIPRSLPALLRAEEMQQRAARVGFDWPDLDGVVAKIHEEVDELAAAAKGSEQVEEFGDLLFALVNLARRLDFSSEGALQHANAKFARRFAAVEEACRQRGVRPEALGLAELDALWNLAKADENRGGP